MEPPLFPRSLDLRSARPDHHLSGDRVRATGFGGCTMIEVGLEPSYAGLVITPAAAFASVAPTY